MKSIEIIQRRLGEYACESEEEELNAIREILQELILAGLARTDFFTKAAFHGGTQLRIFEGIRRYSEDLDFALLAPDRTFALKGYLDKVAKELESVGVRLEVKDKSKADNTIKKGFLKSDSLVGLLELHYVGGRGTLGTPAKTLIKLEVDANPPTGAGYCGKTCLFPYPAGIRCFDRASSFAGKLHALLCRSYVKGRDWFDLIWYASVKAQPNYLLLSAALDQQGPWSGRHVVADRHWVRRELLSVIDRMDWNAAREDVRRFVYASDRPSLDLWSKDFFTSLVDRLMAVPTVDGAEGE